MEANCAEPIYKKYSSSEVITIIATRQVNHACMHARFDTNSGGTTDDEHIIAKIVS